MPPALTAYSDSDSDIPFEIPRNHNSNADCTIDSRAVIDRVPCQDREDFPSDLYQSADGGVEKGGQLIFGRDSHAMRNMQSNDAMAPKETETSHRVSSTQFAARTGPTDISTIERDSVGPGNVEAAPTGPVSSASYRTRLQTSGQRRNEICYDQGYHPMDDFIRPNRAARTKAKYSVVTEEISSDDVSAMGSDSGHEEQMARKEKRVYDISPQGTRRSSRSVNKHVIYNMNVHPQDAELEALEAVEEIQEGPIKRTKLSAVPDSEDEDGEEEIERSSEVSNRTVYTQVLKNITEQIVDTEDMGTGPESSGHNTGDGQEGLMQLHADEPASPTASASDSETRSRSSSDACTVQDVSLITVYEESPKQQFANVQQSYQNLSYPHDDKENKPLRPKLVQDGLNPANGSWPTQQGVSFAIYSEPLQAQVAVERTTPVTQEFEHDDKENTSTLGEIEPTLNSNENVTVVPISAWLQQVRSEHGNDSDDDFHNFTQGGDFHSDEHREAMTSLDQIDGAMADTNDGEQFSNDVQSDEADSVLGVPSPQA